MALSPHAKVIISQVFLILNSVACIFVSGFFIWQLVLAFSMNDTYGISSSIIVIAMLFIAGILGITAAVRHSDYCMNTFTVFAIIICLCALVEIVITAIGTAKCPNLASDESSPVWAFICSSSSWILIIPMSILIVVLVIGVIFRFCLGKAVALEENGTTQELSNYYPS